MEVFPFGLTTLPTEAIFAIAINVTPFISCTTARHKLSSIVDDRQRVVMFSLEGENSNSFNTNDVYQGDKILSHNLDIQGMMGWRSQLEKIRCLWHRPDL